MDARNFFNELQSICQLILPISWSSPIVLILLCMPIFLIIGLVRLMLPDYRTRGLINVGNCFLYIIAIFLIDNGYMPMIGMLLFAVVAIPMGILNLTEGHYYDKKEVKISLIVYGILLALLAGVLFFISGKSVPEFLSGITLLQWKYAVYLVCFGIQFLFLGEWILYFLIAGATSGPPPSNQDGINGATGNEQSVDTTAPSDLSN